MKTIEKYLLLVLSVAMTLACTKNDFSENDNSFKIFVNTLDTKTTNNGMSTIWSSGDRIMVSYALTGSQDYINAGRFNLSNEATGEFKPHRSAPSLSDGSYYDWYVFYPFNSQHTVTNSAGQTIGCLSSQSQTQIGNNTMGHLAGSNFPLYGSVKNIAATDYPNIKLKNVASVIEFSITNKLSKQISISKISLEIPETNIVGNFNIDYSSEPVSLTPTMDSMVSSSVTLNVTNGAMLEPDGVGKFYIGIAPVTVPEGLPLLVNIYVTDGTNEADDMLEKEITESLEFKSGTINTLNLNFTRIF